MIKFKKKPTFLFYDYETFGINPCLDKPAQFACIRTDENLNIIKNTVQCFYCFPPDDYFPDPNSVLITGITPQYAKKNGSNEYIFSKKIYNILTESNTCIVGYNNINFDDEITRNIFYRNFFDPYEWSWKNSNSRWDILSLLRACYALRPNGIEWPQNKLGLPSFKLSDLTQINNIVHTNAHNAMSDVYATIEIAKLIKNKQPKLFGFFFKIRKKNVLSQFINLKKFEPIIYVSNSFGAVRNNISCILPITYHKNNNNVLIAVDLFKDIKELIYACKNISFEDSFIKNLFNLGIVLLYLNRCPMLAPIKVIRQEDYDRLNFNKCLYNENINFFKQHYSIVQKIQNIFSKKNNINKCVDVDLQIYNSFFDIHDKKQIKIVQNTDSGSLNNINVNFHDPRLKNLLFRYRARNFFDTLNNNEKKIWLKYCFKIFNTLSLQSYENNIRDLLKKNSNNEKKVVLLKQLLDYVLKKYDELFYKNINLN